MTANTLSGLIGGLAAALLLGLAGLFGVHAAPIVLTAALLLAAYIGAEIRSHLCPDGQTHADYISTVRDSRGQTTTIYICGHCHRQRIVR